MRIDEEMSKWRGRERAYTTRASFHIFHRPYETNPLRQSATGSVQLEMNCVGQNLVLSKLHCISSISVGCRAAVVFFTPRAWIVRWMVIVTDMHSVQQLSQIVYAGELHSPNGCFTETTAQPWRSTISVMAYDCNDWSHLTEHTATTIWFAHTHTSSLQTLAMRFDRYNMKNAKPDRHAERCNGNWLVGANEIMQNLRGRLIDTTKP